MVLKILFAFACCAAVCLLFWLARGYMLMPLHLGKHERLTIVLTVSGNAPELEQTVDGLCWLCSNGTLCGEIFVRDAGMNKETLEVANILSEKGIIKLIR